MSAELIAKIELEARALLRELAAPAVPGELVSSAIRRAARRAGLPVGRVSRIWYANARQILAFEMDAIRSAVASATERQQEHSRIRDAALGDRVALIETELANLRRRLEGKVTSGESGSSGSLGETQSFAGPDLRGRVGRTTS